MIVKREKWDVPGISAITIFPFVFLFKGWNYDGMNGERTLKHEQIHLEQQRTWFVRGLGVGLLVWWFLYLFVLPVGWNPFRRQWESEAYYIGTGLPLSQIDKLLKQRPYWLWW